MYVCVYEFNRKRVSKKKMERERDDRKIAMCVYNMCECACLHTHTLLTAHQLCVRVCVCVHSCGVLHFIRTFRDGRSDRFRELSHKSAHLHWVSKKQQHKALIVLEI